MQKKKVDIRLQKESNDDKEVLLEKVVIKRLLEVSSPPSAATRLAFKVVALQALELFFLRECTHVSLFFNK